MSKNSSVFKLICLFISICFIVGTAIPPAYAASLHLPPAGKFITLSNNYSFPVLKGLKFDPSNPFSMEFIIDGANKKKVSKADAALLIRYFLASLTIPEEDIWVNLSPYEKNRITSPNLAQTDLGKDLLSQDYILKQLTSSLTYPESDTGKVYWDKIYKDVQRIAGTTNIPINTFNKIWIVPDKAEVYENKNIALITKANLKVMTEQDFLAMNNQLPVGNGPARSFNQDINKIALESFKKTILPKIAEDVNKGKNFATLRQMYHSIILGLWFKKKFKNSLYTHYINKGKLSGIGLKDKTIKDKIYNRYVEAFKKGVYSYIKTDSPQPKTHNSKPIRRQYHSGGFALMPNGMQGVAQTQGGKFMGIGGSSALMLPTKTTDFFEVYNSLSSETNYTMINTAATAITDYNKEAASTTMLSSASSSIRQVTASDGTVYDIPDEFEGVLFGTSGHRGKRGKQVNKGISAVIAQGVSGYVNAQDEFKDKKKILIIGGDPRPNNKKYLEEEARVAIANGLIVFAFEDPMPTPICSFVIRFGHKIFNLGDDEVIVGGINNTPSHNPLEDDGIKFNPGGKMQGAPSGSDVNKVVMKISNTIIDEGTGIKRLPDESSLESHPNYIKVDVEEIAKYYIKRMSKMIDFNLIKKAIKERGLNWLYDTQNGAGGWWARQVFEAIDEDFFEIMHEKSLSDFGGLKKGPNTEKWEQLIPLLTTVKQDRFDGGGATDGDGDRFFFSDENGEPIPFGVVLALLFNYIVNVKGVDGTFKTCVDGSDIFEKIGKVAKRTAIGFKAFQDDLKDPLKKIVLAGESGSGGLSLGSAMDEENIGHTLDKDGNIAQLIFLEMLSDAMLKGKTITGLISELYKTYGYYYTFKVEGIPLPGSVQEGLRIGKKVLDDIEGMISEGKLLGYEIKEVDKTDGLKIFLEDLGIGATYWLLIRLSGTGGGIRAYGETVSLENMEAAVKIGEKLRESRNNLINSLINKHVSSAVKVINWAGGVSLRYPVLDLLKPMLEKIRKTSTQKKDDLLARAKNPNNMVGWKKWPYVMMEELGKQGMFQEARGLREKINSGEVTNVIIFGIGGSTGPVESELDLLYGKAWREGSVNGVRIHILDTPDKERINEILGKVDIKRTALIGNSKSGGTLEFDLGFREFKARLMKVHQEKYNEYIYVVTDKDASKSALRKEAEEKGYHIAGIVPDDIGGRYSIFSAIGMFTLAVLEGQSGIRKISNGASVHEMAAQVEGSTDPTIIIGGLMALLNKKYGSDTVFLAYGAERFRGAKVFVEQLQDESVGEEGKGPSAYMILCDGKERKVDAHLLQRKDLHIHLIIEKLFNEKPELEKEFTQRYEKLEKAGIPQVVLRIPEMDERYLGMFKQMLHNIIGFAGEYLLSDPGQTYFQEGVQLLKHYSNILLGKEPSGTTEISMGERIKTFVRKIVNNRVTLGDFTGTNLDKALKKLGHSPTYEKDDGKILLDLTNILLTAGFDRQELFDKAARIGELFNLDAPELNAFKGKFKQSDINKATLLAAISILSEKKNSNLWAFSNSLSRELNNEHFVDFAAEMLFPQLLRITESPQGHHSVQNGVLRGEDKWLNIIITIDNHGAPLAVPDVKDDHLKSLDYDYVINVLALASYLAFTESERQNVLVMVKDLKDKDYLKDFLKLTVTLAGLAASSSGINQTHDMRSITRSPTGGIAMEGVDIEASPASRHGGQAGSSAVILAPFDVDKFKGFKFEITEMTQIKGKDIPMTWGIHRKEEFSTLPEEKLDLVSK